MSCDEFTPSRREFLTLAGAGAVGAATQATARPLVDVSAFQSEPRRAVLVHDPDFAIPEAFAQRLAAAGGTVVPLAGDPVRLWRDGLKAQVEGTEVLYGYTLWADLLIFRGLARELGRNLRLSQQDAASGRIAWTIA